MSHKVDKSAATTKNISTKYNLAEKVKTEYFVFYASLNTS